MTTAQSTAQADAGSDGVDRGHATQLQWGRRELGALAIVGGTVGLFFLPIWAGGKVFVSDGQFAAFFEPVALWSDAWIGGWPVGADAAGYVFYPLRWLLRTTGSFNAFVMSAYAIAAAGLFAYLRLIGLSNGSALLGGLGFAFSGFMVGHLPQTSMIHAVAWLTPALAGIEGTLATGRRRWAWLAMVSVALSALTGHVQLTTYGLALLATYVAYRLPSAWRAGRLRTWTIATAALAAGILVTAPSLLLASTYLAETPRQSLDFETFASLALPLRQIPALFFPFLLGGGAAPYVDFYIGKGTFGSVCFHVPFLLLLLAANGCRSRPHGVYWLGVAVASFTFALGDQVPLVASILYRVPGLNLFRAPGRHLMELCFALSVLAALGCEDLIDPERRRRLASWLLPALVAAGFVCAFIWVTGNYRALGDPARMHRTPLPGWRTNPALVVPTVLAVAAGVAYAVAQSRLDRRFKLAVIVTVAAVQAWAFVGWSYYTLWSVPPATLAPTALESEVLERLKTTPGRVLNLSGDFGTIFTPERSRLFGVPSVNWHGQLVPQRAVELLGVEPTGVFRSTTGLTPESAVFDLYGVRFAAIEATPEGHFLYGVEDEKHWRLVGKDGRTHVFENLRARPLAWLVGTWRPLPDEEVLPTLRGEDGRTFDPAREALVADLGAGKVDGFDPGSADALWRGPSELEVTVRSASGGLLVVGINDLRGWQAQLDGRPVAHHRVDYALLGVPVPAGSHVVRWRFAPTAWRGGMVLSVVGLLGFAALARRLRDPRGGR